MKLLVNPHYIENSNSRQVLNEIIGGGGQKEEAICTLKESSENKLAGGRSLNKTQELEEFNETFGGKVGVYTKVFQSI